LVKESAVSLAKNLFGGSKIEVAAKGWVFIRQAVDLLLGFFKGSRLSVCGRGAFSLSSLKEEYYVQKTDLFNLFCPGLVPDFDRYGEGRTCRLVEAG
jgi:hypothetical protein